MCFPTCSDLNLEDSVEGVVYMAMPYVRQVSKLRTLKGYELLSPSEQVQFKRYVLFQLAFALHTLASLGCSHRDAAKLRISSNVHLHEMAAAEDPCGSRAGAGSSSSGCPWGHCWSSAGRLWCFNREQTPLAHVLVQLFDFGTTTCKLPARQGEPW